ncbi:hypothetical protein JG687_00004131 [Phytophthora cactorum]|uniref:Uncharacterized protein n=1 Tax=Phytophthora cactorum TaxID=29920 RepID=A0A8T1UPK6_9STRA|nr:hypothetical protein PC120_g19751 [Phytophthora cactorum]KAG3068640.1 hypothetical protein PC121_g10140 [Phytophthora cactorum]KAG6967703.1 hypothetical protein JG687_00004131 [Phytophthora cactorum]
MAHWWRRDELLALLQAWEQTLDAPRDRDELTELELQRLYAKFDALRPRDGASVPVQEVEAQRQRLVRTFLFLRAFNAESTRAGRPTWFELPTQQQDSLRHMNGRLGELATVAPDEFEVLRRICEELPPPPPVQTETPQRQVQAQDRPMVDEMKAAAEALAGLPMFRPNPTPQLSPPLSPVATVNKGTLESESKREGMSESDGLAESESEDEYIPRKIRKREVDTDYTPPKAKGKSKVKMTSKWSKRDEQRLLSAWHEVVTVLADDGFAGSFASRNEGLRLNSLIHQRYAELCGDNSTPRTNQSTGAKKHAIVMAFRALRNVLRTLASQSDRPNWFGMTPEERMELQMKFGHHNEQAVFIEKETYQRLVQIDKAQQIVLTPAADAPRAPATLDELLGRTKGGPRKKVGRKSSKEKYASGPPRGFVIADKSSEESEEESSDDAASIRNERSENSSRGANSQPRPKKLARKSFREVDLADDSVTNSPLKRRRSGLSDAKWVTRLLDTQTQRFEALLAEFQEERRQERQHNVEIILEALKLRSASAQKADQPSPFVEALVDKQRQHLLGLFNQLQDERSQEREQARMLLRELGNARLVQDQEQKD